jgi:hypothetical protein
VPDTLGAAVFDGAYCACEAVLDWAVPMVAKIATVARKARVMPEAASSRLMCSPFGIKIGTRTV